MNIPRATRHALTVYVRAMADGLALRDWTFILEYDGKELTGETARIVCVYGRRLATITFCEAFWAESRHEQRGTIIHELVHAHLDGMEAVVRDMEQQLGDFVHSMLVDTHHRAVEIATDALATAIAPRFPLPPRLHLNP